MEILQREYACTLPLAFIETIGLLRSRLPAWNWTFSSAFLGMDPVGPYSNFALTRLYNYLYIWAVIPIHEYINYKYIWRCIYVNFIGYVSWNNPDKYKY
jgi:hypothetical protein